MSRQIDTSKQLNSDDILYLAARDAIPGNQIPKRYRGRIDDEQVRAALAGEGSTKLRVKKTAESDEVEEEVEPVDPDAPTIDPDAATEESK